MCIVWFCLKKEDINKDICIDMLQKETQGISVVVTSRDIGRKYLPLTEFPLYCLKTLPLMFYCYN